jgi:hypothetical protein
MNHDNCANFYYQDTVLKEHQEHSSFETRSGSSLSLSEVKVTFFMISNAGMCENYVQYCTAK